jgi:curli biogenesis system outer membrane secretion channel CsgG
MRIAEFGNRGSGRARGRFFCVILVGSTVLAGCATPSPLPSAVQAPASVVDARKQADLAPPAVKSFKRKLALGRFTNETRYGKALLGGDLDPLGRQTGDMLSARLVESGRFIVLERPDVVAVKAEQALAGGGDIVGTDTLIVGSLTEFGRAAEGQAGFLSNTKRQIARAKVEIRLVDVRTGHAYFSATGAGEAAVEQGTVLGFGSRADYDATLNDRAIGAAISDVLSSLVGKLEERAWRSDILKVDGPKIFISGGTRQGLKPGDRLAIMRAGERMKSAQSGFEIDLPPSRVAEVVVDSTFGNSVTNEGSVTQIVSGSITGGSTSGLFVAELN